MKSLGRDLVIVVERSIVDGVSGRDSKVGGAKSKNMVISDSLAKSK